MDDMIKIILEDKRGNLRVGQMPDLHMGAKIRNFNAINSQTGNFKQWDQQIEDLEKTTNILVEKDISVVIYPGDIYDRASNVSDKVQAAVRESILRFIRKGIVVILFTGNHDFPKTREYKAIISAYEGIGEYLNVVPIFKARYEKVNINDEILIHCIPQCFSKDQFRAELSKVKRDDRFEVNILTTHVGVQGAGINEYEHSEAWINKLELEMDIDYVALGDYHRPLKVSPKVAYAGVLSKNNFGDRDSKHGVIVYHGDTKEVEFCQYETRGMKQFDIECKDMPVEEINDALEEIANNIDPEVYMKVVLKDISKLKYKQLDSRHTAKLKKDAFYCNVSYEYEKVQIDEDNVAVGESSSIKSIMEEFVFALSLTTKDKDDKERERICTLYKDKVAKEI